MAGLADILSPVWTMSIDGGGAIVEGIAAIKQCINVIIRTTPGTDPLRPDFGCGLANYVDLPMNVAIPNMKKAILDAIALWETRVKITKITHKLGDSGQVIFYIGYTLTDGTADALILSVSSGGVISGVTPQRVVLRALLPSGSGTQYQVFAQVNGADILPVPPVSGFTTVSELFTWVGANWGNYANWYLTADSLVGSLFPQYTSGSLAVSLLAVRSIYATVPPSFNYTVTVVVDGVTYTETGITFAGGILQYLTNDPTLGQLGTWSIAYVPGDFGDDFGDDFDTFTPVIQLITESASDITLTVTGA